MSYNEFKYAIFFSNHAKCFLSKAVILDSADVTLSLLAVRLHGNYSVDFPVNIKVMYDSVFTKELHTDRESGAR